MKNLQQAYKQKELHNLEDSITTVEVEINKLKRQTKWKENERKYNTANKSLKQHIYALHELLSLKDKCADLLAEKNNLSRELSREHEKNEGIKIGMFLGFSIGLLVGGWIA